MKTIIELLDCLDAPKVNGEKVGQFLRDVGATDVQVKTVCGDKGSTDFVRVFVAGKNGKANSGSAPTIGIVGRLGGIGARPGRLGFTSDGDGALAALSVAAKLAKMKKRGDVLEGDVIIVTHICPHAPTRPHDPVPFMESPISSAMCNSEEVESAMDAIVSIDTTKGNRLLNMRGIAITPTVKDGYILRVSEDLLSLFEVATGRLPAVFPITQQDITPYGNALYHVNSIMQPSVATSAPCIGLAVTTQSQVAGCATGATHVSDVDEAVRFCVEVAKAYTSGICHFYDVKEYELMQKLYGTLSHFRTQGRKA